MEGLYLLAAHVLSNWLLQPDWMAERKFTDLSVRAPLAGAVRRRRAHRRHRCDTGRLRGQLRTIESGWKGGVGWCYGVPLTYTV